MIKRYYILAQDRETKEESVIMVIASSWYGAFLKANNWFPEKMLISFVSKEFMMEYLLSDPKLKETIESIFLDLLIFKESTIKINGKQYDDGYEIIKTERRGE